MHRSAPDAMAGFKKLPTLLVDDTPAPSKRCISVEDGMGVGGIHEHTKRHEDIAVAARRTIQKQQVSFRVAQLVDDAADAFFKVTN